MFLDVHFSRGTGVFTARCYAQRGYKIACRLSVRLSVNERTGLKLFGREIIFEEFQPLGSQYLNVTDRRNV